MGYVGGNVADFFGEGARAATSRATEDMTNDGAESVKRVAAMNTPVKTGELRAAWYTTSARPSVSEGGDTGYGADIANDTSYAGYVEEGTGLYGPKHAPYLIKPKTPGGVLRWVAKDGTVVFARYVLHPGSPGNHMLAIGLNVTEGLAQDGGLFIATLEKWVREVEGQAERQR